MRLTVLAKLLINLIEVVPCKFNETFSFFIIVFD